MRGEREEVGETEIFKEREAGTSLVIQWLRFHLPVQGFWVRSLIRELKTLHAWGPKNLKHKTEAIV